MADFCLFSWCFFFCGFYPCKSPWKKHHLGNMCFFQPPQENLSWLLHKCLDFLFNKHFDAPFLDAPSEVTLVNLAISQSPTKRASKLNSIVIFCRVNRYAGPHFEWRFARGNSSQGAIISSWWVILCYPDVSQISVFLPLPPLSLEEYSVDAIPAPVANGSNTATIIMYSVFIQHISAIYI